MDARGRPQWSRREFLKQAAATAGCVAAGTISGCGKANRTTVRPSGVFIVNDPADPVTSSTPVQWSIEQLYASLTAKGIATEVGRRVDQADRQTLCIVVSSASSAMVREVLSHADVSVAVVPESLGLVPGELLGRQVLLACGSDVRGLVYAILELADRVEYASEPLAALEVPHALVEEPANPIRSIMRVFASDVEDKSWYHDKTFWPPYLSMLVAQRFNRFALALGLGYDFTSHLRDTYFHFAYPFLLSVPGYNVRVAELPDAERDRNLEMLRFISDETARRGLQFQLGIWTHAYKWTDSPGVNYTIEGLSPENHAAYCRAALEALLKACPSISGVTFRIHGESGVAEGSYEFWKTVFEGVVRGGRRVEIDMHAKGMDAKMIELAVATGMPVNISPKYWAEHMGLPYHQAAIRAVELPRQNRQDQGFFSRSSGSRSFLRYGYGDLLSENRTYGVLHRMWPGTQRLLLWGDPVMAAAYGRASSFCGSSGAELFEPLSFKGRKGSGLPGGRDAYADASLRPTRDYEKYLYEYRLWGRLLYHPGAQPETWRRFLSKEYGPAALACEGALASASRILPLFTTAHTPSAANNNYWPEMYTNMPIVDASRPHPYGDTPSPKRFGTVSPLDPQLFAGVDEYAKILLEGGSTAKYSPAEVARWLEGLAATAQERLHQAEAQIADRRAPAFRRLAVDVAVQSGLGRFFAVKLRAGVLYAIYDQTGDPAALQEALKAYRVARTIWAEMAAQAQEVYVRDITFGGEKQLRGHWLDRLPDIDQDIADMEKRAQSSPTQGQAGAASPEAVARAVQTVLGRVERPKVHFVHVVLPSFVAGQPLPIELTLFASPSAVASVRLCYRHVHQAQSYQSADMQMQGNHCRATIPAEYTNTPYPLEYYFELRDAAGRAWMCPDFEAMPLSQPYFVVRPAQKTIVEMNMLRNHILHLLQKDDTPRKLVHLEQELGVRGELRMAFRDAIDSLCAEGRLIVGPGNVVSLPSLSGEVTGIFRANARGYGFLTPEQSMDDGDVFIPAKATGSAMTGDRVVARITRRGRDAKSCVSKDDGRLTGEIVRVLNRAHTSVVGTLLCRDAKSCVSTWLVQPDGGDFSRPVEIESVDARKVRPGDKVSVEIRFYPTHSQPARGVIAEVLGRPGRFDTETTAVIQRHHLCDAFDASSLVEASNAKMAFDPRNTRDREDITDELIVTIDPPDAKDFDDAVSLALDEQGRWVLGVHIADVSHFVPEGLALDRAARRRGNTVYLPGRTLPMLPEMLSNGICSLQPGQPRYTKSVYLVYNKDGQVQSTHFANTIIKSSARLTYQEADRILKGDSCGFSPEVVALLQEMDTLARAIETRRRRAGMIQLKMAERELVLDDSGQVIGVEPADTSYPHTIIEMFMVEANVAVATLLDRYCIPFMRRIHPEPDAHALRQLSQTLRLLGVTLSSQPQRSDLQTLLDRIQTTRMALPVNILVLRSLEIATYSPASIGHYALAASKYCHFTSPIRRYADLMVHRALQSYLTGNLERARRLYAFPDLEEIGRHISETEQTAEEAEQELKTILVLHLLRKQIGQELTGIVVNLTAFGASVHLPEYGVEGLIPREALGPDHWQFDEQSQCLVGRYTGAILRLAQALRVRIVDVHPAAGQLDLAPAHPLIAKVPGQNQQNQSRRKHSQRHRRGGKGRSQ